MSSAPAVTSTASPKEPAGPTTTKDIEDYIRERKHLGNDDMATTDVDKFEMAPTTEHTVDISATNRRNFVKRSRFVSRSSVQSKGKTVPGTGTVTITAHLEKTDAEEPDLFEEILSSFGGFWFYAFIGAICTVSVLLAIPPILCNTGVVDF